MPNNVQFRFQCKPLPKPEYETLSDLRRKHGLTTWQAVILVIRLAKMFLHVHPEALQGVLEGVSEQHPDSRPR